MNENKTLNLINHFLDKHSKKEQAMRELGAQLATQQSKLDECLFEQQITSKALQALQDVRPILVSVSSNQAIALANQALRHVFNTEDQLFFSEDESRFYISTPEGDTDLVTANGGGYLAVISFIFTIFLLIKGNYRRLLFYDEHFTVLGDLQLEKFILFVRNLCKDLGLDLLLISHDSRIEVSDVDNFYYLESGYLKKVK